MSVRPGNDDHKGRVTTDLEEDDHILFHGIIPSFAWRTDENYKTTSITIDGKLADILNVYIPKISFSVTASATCLISLDVNTMFWA